MSHLPVEDRIPPDQLPSVRWLQLTIAHSFDATGQPPKASVAAGCGGRSFGEVRLSQEDATLWRVLAVPAALP